MTARPIFVLAAAAAAALVAGCTVGPDYRRPAAPAAAGWKEAPPGKGWKVAAPSDAAARGDWWSVYGDPVLDGLIKRVEVSNQNLRAAEAAYRQARATADQARAGLFPTLSLNGSAQRSGSGPGASTSSTSLRRSATAQTRFGATGEASWEPDLWGRIRRTVEGDVARVEASEADIANARLSAQAELASDYFQLRAADEQKHLLDEAVAAYARSLEIARNQYAAGFVPRSDVSSAETQLRTTQSQAINVGISRAQLEHAIAVLAGEPPSALTIAPAPLAADVPAVPPGLPSELLERRPDIAAAERRVAAANAQIGVAQAAFYPSLTLSGSYGFQGSALGTLIQAPNAVWSLGSSLAATIFDAGARRAGVEAARAAYDQNVATYRQTVLGAFQSVEDQLASLRILEQQAAVQADAVRAADENERLALNQYRAGTVAFTAVVQAQTAALSNRETALTIRRNRFVASVDLITALGGSWQAGSPPAPALGPAPAGR